MCICCVAVPVVAGTGLSLDKKQHQQVEQQELALGQARPFLILTVIATLILIVGSVVIHTRFYQFGL